MNELTVLADKYECDKGSLKHNYTQFYYQCFHPYRDEQFNMLEIGWGVGASVKMWLDYFKNINLFMLSIENNPHAGIIADKRFTYIRGNQTSKVVLRTIRDMGIKFKFIIDDGSHVPEDMLFTMGTLFTAVEPGGCYIIEDLDWRAYKPRHNKNFKTVPLMIERLAEYRKTQILKNELISEAEEAEVNACIESVQIYNEKLACIRRMK